MFIHSHDVNLVGFQILLISMERIKYQKYLECELGSGGECLFWFFYEDE